MTDTPGSGTADPRPLSWRERWAAYPPAFQGLLLGSFAALCYSLTNVGLRQPRTKARQGVAELDAPLAVRRPLDAVISE